MGTEKNDMRELLDVEKMRQQIKMDLSQEHNWDKQQQHWQLMQQHWQHQRTYWYGIGVLGLVAVIVNGLAAFFAN